MKRLISLIYVIVIASAITTFVGLASYAFYPEPEYDQTCYQKHRSSDSSEYSTRYSSPYDDEAADECQDARDLEQDAHAANTAIIGLVATTVLVVLALKIRLKVEEINDGIAVGSIFTAIYTVAWAGSADHRILLFLSGTVFLVSAIVAGLIKFKK